MTGVFARIILRVVAGFLIAKGWFAPKEIEWITTDPDVLTIVNIGVGAAIWAATEFYYCLAKRFRWAT
ncbi:hypothetical protein [Pseudohoeflea coraliihabitans]|uniref:Uncharacterized protein n=1 Tax=Pseudohoeflea coraliihabitans TaxID=2860393 RepID=A0ABS6WTI2_9HYPH|nr:hypothetical protein [Pseudohoeflea sp. DP4N28-3]MBW3099274.1 hypothetical protein [Pseudohoeflea sp. DP4N28-3]